jgi:hypothetical protein
LIWGNGTHIFNTTPTVVFPPGSNLVNYIDTADSPAIIV